MTGGLATAARPVASRQLLHGALLAVGVATGLLMAHVIVGRLVEGPGTYLLGDFRVYHGAGVTVRHGEPIYEFATHDGWRFVYPPFALVFLVPLSLLALPAAYWLWTAGSVLALHVTVLAVIRSLGVDEPRRRGRLTLQATVLMIPLFPVAQTLGFGQINIYLMCLVVVDLLLVGRKWQGIAIGVAAGIKLTPLIFIGYLLVTRRVRAAATASLAFLATIGLGYLLLPAESRSYWGGLFFDTSRTAPPGEEPLGQSIRAVLVQVAPALVESVWLPIGVVVGIAGLATAAWASRRGDELAGMIGCALTGLLISPVSWEAHWVWCVPLLIYVAWHGWRSSHRWAKLGVVLLWLVFALFHYRIVLEHSGIMPTEQRGRFLPIDHLYVATGAGYLVLLAARLVRTGPR